MKLNVGDSIKTKDGRNFKCIDYTDTHYILEDTNGNQVKLKKDEKSTVQDSYSQEARSVMTVLSDFGLKADRVIVGDYFKYIEDLNEKYHFFEDEKIKGAFLELYKNYLAFNEKRHNLADLIVKKIDEEHPTTDSAKEVIDSSDFTTPTEEEIQRVLIHLCKTGNAEETVERVCDNYGVDVEDFDVDYCKSIGIKIYE